MREVKTQDWPAFCDRLNANAQGGTISIHKVEATGGKRLIIENSGFESIEHGLRDDCNDRLSVRLSGAGEHEMVEPIRIKLMTVENGSAFQSVIVEAEDGVTILTFHPMIRAVWLEGINLQ